MVMVLNKRLALNITHDHSPSPLPSLCQPVISIYRQVYPMQRGLGVCLAPEERSLGLITLRCGRRDTRAVPRNLSDETHVRRLPRSAHSIQQWGPQVLSHTDDGPPIRTIML